MSDVKPYIGRFNTQFPEGGSGDGDVKGPDSSVTNHVASFDDTTGKVLKDSGVTLQTGGPTDQFLNASGNYSSPGSSSTLNYRGQWDATTQYNVGDTVLGNAAPNTGITRYFLAFRGANDTNLVPIGNDPTNVDATTENRYWIEDSSMVLALRDVDIDAPTPQGHILYWDESQKKWRNKEENTGDVTGPSSSTDGNLASFSGTTGKIIQDGGTAKATGAQVILGTNDTNYVTPKALAEGDVPRVKASGSTIDTGTNDTEYVTPKALADSNIRNISDAKDLTKTGAAVNKVVTVASVNGDDLTFNLSDKGGGTGGNGPDYEASFKVKGTYLSQTGLEYNPKNYIPYAGRDRRLNDKPNALLFKSGLNYDGADRASSLIYELGTANTITNTSSFNLKNLQCFWTCTEAGTLVITPALNGVWDSTSNMDYPDHDSHMQLLVEYVISNVGPRLTTAVNGPFNANSRSQGGSTNVYDFFNFNFAPIVLNVQANAQIQLYTYFYSNTNTSDGPTPTSDGVDGLYLGSYGGGGPPTQINTPSVLNFKLYKSSSGGSVV